MQLNSIPVCVLALCVLAPKGSAQQIPDRPTLDALLGSNQTLEDFESFDLPEGEGALLDVATLDDTTVANGQGPGLVEVGATYVDHENTTLQWNGDAWFGLVTKSILSGSLELGAQINIVYGPLVQAMGVDLVNFEGFGYTGTVTFKDGAGQVLGTIPVMLTGTPNERVFVGWQHAAGIGSVEIESPTYTFSPIIDDHGYGDFAGLGTIYCSANSNSTGSPAGISASGSASSSAGDLTLEATPVPDENGIFFHAANQSALPFGNGFLCTIDFLRRGQIVTASVNLATYTYDNSILKKNLSDWIGTTRNFQYWFRDPMGGGAMFNTSNAISIDILP